MLSMLNVLTQSNSFLMLLKTLKIWLNCTAEFLSILTLTRLNMSSPISTLTGGCSVVSVSKCWLLSDTPYSFVVNSRRHFYSPHTDGVSGYFGCFKLDFGTVTLRSFNMLSLLSNFLARLRIKCALVAVYCRIFNPFSPVFFTESIYIFFICLFDIAFKSNCSSVS